MAPWVKLDDCFSEHPKVEQAGDLAAWMYVCGLQYCSRALSDGFIPATRVPRLTGLQKPMKLADTLVEVGLWERVDGGFLVHDYVEHQRTSEQIKRERKATAERVTRHRQQRSGNAVTPPVTNGAGNARVTPPDTDTDKNSPQTPQGVDRYAGEFEDWAQHHAEVTGLSLPAKTTKAWKSFAASFRQRRQEGYSVADLKAATIGAFNDSYRREHGYYDIESVLRPTKVHKLVEKGKGSSPCRPAVPAHDPAAMRADLERRLAEDER